MKEKLTILTPTYNRSNKLTKLYSSLINQTTHEFIWTIVDDGSTDDTKVVVDEFDKEKFDIIYIHKKNGGKHTAINEGVNHIKTELVFIVDSDDILVDDAIETIIYEWSAYADNNLCGLSFLKATFDGKVSGKEFPENRVISSFIKMRINRNDKSEKAEIWRTDLLKRNPFPVFENEKFVSEGPQWSLISNEKDILFVNKVIYLFQYEDGGLTKLGKKLRLSNPQGGIFETKVALTLGYKWTIKLKKMLLYIVYSFFAKKTLSEMYYQSPKKLMFLICFPYAYLLYLYWKYKYFEK